MIKLNKYIHEAWSGVKQRTNNAEIEAWCDEMGIENYTINSKGEIDVDGNVTLNYKDFDFKELPYKFGKIKGWFNSSGSKNLTSLKNYPNEVGGYFSCSFCPKLNSLEGCPKEVGKDFFCSNCKRDFTKEEIMSLCKVKGIGYIHI